MKRDAEPERSERPRRRKLLADFVSGMVLSVEVSDHPTEDLDELPPNGADPERR